MWETRIENVFNGYCNLLSSCFAVLLSCSAESKKEWWLDLVKEADWRSSNWSHFFRQDSKLQYFWIRINDIMLCRIGVYVIIHLMTCALPSIILISWGLRTISKIFQVLSWILCIMRHSHGSVISSVVFCSSGYS